MQLHVERRGKGKPILLLHGLVSDHRQVEPILSALKEYEIFMPDLLGCGKSEKVVAPDIVDRNVKALNDLCKQHNINTVIAFSISGIIALKLQLPNTVFIATFCSNPLAEGALKPLHGREVQIEQLLRKYEPQAANFIRTLQREPVPGVKDASVPCAVEYMHAAIEDNTSLAKKLKHVLVVHGTQDKLIDYKLGMQLAAASGAEFVTVPEGHFSVLKNETAHQAISAFVRAHVSQ